MKKLLGILSIFLLATSMTGCSDRGTTSNNTDCGVEDLDGTVVCFKDGSFLIEKGAKLRFGTDTDDYGKAIVALWDKTYPEYAGAVEYVNTGAAGAADELATQQGEYPDVFMVIDGEVPRNSGHMLPLPTEIKDKAMTNSPAAFYESGNTSDDVYVPITYDGMAFVWNKTMLDTLGYDTTDANGDGLPEAFDTWEEIFALSTEWQTSRPTYEGKVMDVVFPLTLDNEWADYFHLASAGWQIFENGPTDPGYETPEFKKGFDFMLAARDAKISVDASGALTPGEAMTWRYDDVISNNLAPFGLYGTWMNIEDAPAGTQLEISVLPTWNGKNTTPFVKTKGYVVNAYTKNRSAAAALLDLVYSKEGIQAMVDNSGYAPALVENSELQADLSNAKVQEALSSAFVYHYPEPGMTLPNNKNMKAMDAAYYGFIKDAEIAVWNGTMTVDEAIAQLIELTDAKIAMENK